MNPIYDAVCKSLNMRPLSDGVHLRFAVAPTTSSTHGIQIESDDKKIIWYFPNATLQEIEN